MKKIYVMPMETVVELGLEGLLADSGTSTGSYNGSGNPSGDGDGMDEDNPVKSQRIMDKQW